MPQPINWLPLTQTNIGTADIPNANDSQIIGLSNGNFLVAWTETGTTGVGTSAGTDIIGKIFNSQGVLVRDSFRMNNNNIDDEFDFDLAATEDGGFVLVYVDDSIANIDQTSIIFERRTATGTFSLFSTVADENIVADSLSNPSVTYNLSTGVSTFSYTDNVGGNANINGVNVSSTGVASAEFALAQNSTDADTAASIAVLTNGNIASVYGEVDAGTSAIEIKVVSATGTPIAGSFSVTTNASGDAQVAALANGNMVVAWSENGGDVFFKILNSVGAPVTITVQVGQLADVLNEPSVIGLPQGGFILVYDDDTANTIVGQLYNNTGTPVGVAVTLATGGSEPTVSATADGRILVTHTLAGNVFHSIWDPRGQRNQRGDL